MELVIFILAISVFMSGIFIASAISEVARAILDYRNTIAVMHEERRRNDKGSD